jgi:hypothetical protein
MDNPLCNPAEFRRWTEHPLTVAYRQFLKDHCLQLAMEWAQGSAPSDSPAMIQAQCQAETLGDLADLEVNDVRRFYGLVGIEEEGQ